MEILRQHKEPIEAIFVPVGGGGLIAGIAAYVKFQAARRSKSSASSRTMPTASISALKAEKRVKLDQVGIFADGVAVAQVGAETFRIAREHVDQVIRVSTDEICAAIKDIFADTRAIAEPAGALGVAGINKYLARGPRSEKGA